MAARDIDPHSNPPSPGPFTCLSARALGDRLEEEINRAGRHGTPLSCLLVVIDNLDELSSEHGSELSEQTLAYVGPALRRELRRFDRIGRPSDGELLVVLPGADSTRGEIVAKRVLDRLRTIKVEANGIRRPLSVSVGIAAWHIDATAEDLLDGTRAAARRGHGVEDPSADIAATEPQSHPISSSPPAGFTGPPTWPA
ncbi:MAG TPA: diguanylate cyclase [Solirubrobacteraceae bacterium]|jgi:diguanylate cyclase (GGDEF)-like protein